MPPGGPSTASATTAAGLALHACAAMGMKVSLMRSLEEILGNDVSSTIHHHPSKNQGALMLIYCLQ
jgi:hypothetical protein